MRLVNFRRGNRIEFGVERDGFVRSLASAGYGSDAEFFAGGAKALEAAGSALRLYAYPLCKPAASDAVRHP